MVHRQPALLHHLFKVSIAQSVSAVPADAQENDFGSIGYFEIFETLTFVHLVLRLSAQVQQRLRFWLEEHLVSVKKQE